jgi:hypothetical protein
MKRVELRRVIDKIRLNAVWRVRAAAPVATVRREFGCEVSSARSSPAIRCTLMPLRAFRVRGFYLYRSRAPVDCAHVSHTEGADRADQYFERWVSGSHGRHAANTLSNISLKKC